MPEKRVLLLYISEVSGHHQATLAIEAALRQLEPNAKILNINAFRQTTPISEKIINQLYLKVIKRTPQIWKYLYDNPSFIKNTRQIKKIIHKFNSPKLKAIVDDFKPDCIVCTQAYPCGMIADCKKSYGLDIPLIGILTDYAPHSFWIYDEVDYYIVPAEEVKERFIQKGVDAKKIINFGIPIYPKFAKNKNKNYIAYKYGLDINKPIILIMGGGQGIGPIKDIVKYIDALGQDEQLVVICGINKKLFKRLKRLATKSPKKIVVLEYVQTIDELMEIASIIVTKPGGLTTAEALAKGLPFIIVSPIPGQEAANAAFLVKKGVGIKIENMEEFPAAVSGLLSNRQKLTRMSFQARQISKPRAAVDIASLILRLCPNISYTG